MDSVHYRGVENAARPARAHAPDSLPQGRVTGWDRTVPDSTSNGAAAVRSTVQYGTVQSSKGLAGPGSMTKPATGTKGGRQADDEWRGGTQGGRGRERVDPGQAQRKGKIKICRRKLPAPQKARRGLPAGRGTAAQAQAQRRYRLWLWHWRRLWRAEGRRRRRWCLCDVPVAVGPVVARRGPSWPSWPVVARPCLSARHSLLSLRSLSARRRLQFAHWRWPADCICHRALSPVAPARCALARRPHPYD